ncbi:MAG: hypothetical protein KBD00_02205 [Candidatus Peribacteraceae bacterium]|nr:hypothetical protein [Candidatus Peribacteraceae bacterium]
MPPELELSALEPTNEGKSAPDPNQQKVRVIDEKIGPITRDVLDTIPWINKPPYAAPERLKKS